MAGVQGLNFGGFGDWVSDFESRVYGCRLRVLSFFAESNPKPQHQTPNTNTKHQTPNTKHQTLNSEPYRKRGRVSVGGFDSEAGKGGFGGGGRARSHRWPRVGNPAP